MFPLPRILYAMSTDGLIFKTFGVISTKFQTPVIGTLCAAALTSCFAGLFDLAALVNMLSIGVLLAYTVVAISIIILRYFIVNINLSHIEKIARWFPFFIHWISYGHSMEDIFYVGKNHRSKLASTESIDLKNYTHKTTMRNFSLYLLYSLILFPEKHLSV